MKGPTALRLDCQTRILLCLMMGKSTQDGPRMTLTGNPAKSQCLKATAQRVSGALELSVLQDLQWRAVGAWDTASQHSRECGAAHSGLLKTPPQRDIRCFHPDSLWQGSRVIPCAYTGRGTQGLWAPLQTPQWVGRCWGQVKTLLPGPWDVHIRMGHSQNLPTTPKSPLPVWKHVAPTRGFPCNLPDHLRKFHKAQAFAIFCPHRVYLIDDPTNSHWQPFVA